MRLLIVHPVFSYLGGGESLCCESIRSLLSNGHELTVLTEEFDKRRVESFIGYTGLFDRVDFILYPSGHGLGVLGGYSHLIHHLRHQKRALSRSGKSKKEFDAVFSTQDAGYVPDVNLPVIQWGYFPNIFPHFSPRHSLKTLPDIVRFLPLRWHYEEKISRINLVLAISKFSKWHFDREWNRPSTVVYPPCHPLHPQKKRNLVITAGRANPEKRLDLFWRVARLMPQYEFVMLAISDAQHTEYGLRLSRDCPKNGRISFNSPKETYRELLGQSKVYIHLMEQERFGITIVEAMSARCVPIVHDSGAPREIVKNDVGFLWGKLEDIPNQVEMAMEKSPSLAAEQSARKFNVEEFEKRLSLIFSRL